MHPSARGAGPAAGDRSAALRVLADVATATSLREGDAGVLRVLRALARMQPAPTRAVARDTRLPVPVVAAVLNELRARGYVASTRPAALTAEGEALGAALAVWPPVGADLGAAGATHAPIPAALSAVTAELAEIVERGPAVDLTLDQSHCTAETKVRRILSMLATGGLPAPTLLAIGDDDLMAIAVVKVGHALGRPLVGEVEVVDISADILAAIDKQVGGDADVVVTLTQHDLRNPLPAGTRARHSVAMTDPPYTAPGARLFLSRALEGLRPGPGRDVYFHFGPKAPAESLEVQRVLLDLELALLAMEPAFDEYVGSGVIGGVADAYHLVTAGDRGDAAPYIPEGPLYTAEVRNARREFECTTCRARYVVGRGAEWVTVGDLKRAGCPACGGARFAPGRLVREEERR